MKQGESGDLVERIAADDAFGLSVQDVRALIDPASFVGRAPEQVDHFLEGEVAPVLALRSGSVRPTAEVHV